MSPICIAPCLMVMKSRSGSRSPQPSQAASCGLQSSSRATDYGFKKDVFEACDSGDNTLIGTSSQLKCGFMYMETRQLYIYYTGCKLAHDVKHMALKVRMRRMESVKKEPRGHCPNGRKMLQLIQSNEEICTRDAEDHSQWSSAFGVPHFTLI